jgi:preprotein translocase subunit SecG
MGILYGILVALLVLDGIVLGLVVLMQAGKGGGLAAMGGGAAATEGILAGRQAATVFTRASWICGGIFMTLALVLSIMSSRAQAPTSILEQDFRSQQAPGGTPQPVVPGAGATGAAPETAPTEPAPTPPAGR